MSARLDGSVAAPCRCHVSAWEGDLSELGALADNLHRLALVPSQASAEASREIAQLIDQQFDAGIDPYGVPWEPLAKSTVARGRTDPPMTDTRRLRDTMRVFPLRGAGIAVTSDAEYLGFHQGEGSPNANVPPRHVLPEGEIPDTWERAIADALDNAFERTLSSLGAG